jgi:hypothetical protein
MQVLVVVEKTTWLIKANNPKKYLIEKPCSKKYYRVFLSVYHQLGSATKLTGAIG